MESPPSPNEQDILISRLVARISELEERLYRQELESPAVPQATAAPRSEPQRPRPESSLLAAFKDGWRSNSSSGGAAAPSPTDWFFSLARPQPPGQSQSQPQTQAQAQAGQPQQLQGRRLQYDPHPLSHPQQHLQQLQVGTPTGRHSSSGGLEAVDSHALSDASSSPRNSSSPVHSLRVSIAGAQQGQEQGQGGGSGGGGGVGAGPGEGVAGERSKASASSSSRTSVDGAMGERTGIGRGGERRGPSALTSSTEAQGDEQQQGEAGATAAAAAAATEAGSAQASDQGQGHAAPLTSSTSGVVDFEIMPSMKLNTPLIIHGRGAPQSQQPGPSTQSASGPVSKPFAPQDWLSSLFSSSKRSQQAPQHGGGAVAYARAFNEKSFQAQLEEQGREMEASAADGDVSGSYYRYVFDPVDVQAEMEVTSRVRKAAAEALMEAQEKLRAAEEVQAHLRQQLEDAMQLQQEVEQLKRDKEAALKTKKELEDQMIASTSKLEGMEQASQSLQDELEGLRQQRDIWRNASSNEQDKLKAENTLLRSQLQTRLNDLQLTKSKLGDAEADKQRLLRDLEDQATKLQWLQRINSQLESSAEQLEQYKKASAEFQQKFIRERNVRRKLHEQLQVLKGNIRVVCRVRPPLPGQGSIVGYPLEGLLSVSPPDRREHEFEFDHVFPPESTQEEVYEEVSSLVRSCADGYNVCIFAYGQTGSGKTFTMEGPAENPGIYVRALQELFAFAGEEGSAPAIGNGSSGGGGSASNSPNGKGQVASKWQICVSMIEIYLDAVHDLLRPSSEVTKPLEVSALRAGEMPPGMDRVQGLTWRSVSNTQDVQQVLKEGSKNRSTASTALNAHSSRSHAVLSVRLDFTSSDNQPCSSCIHLVDLAGSERVGKSEVTGQQLKEAQSINKSLSALGEVIAALQRRSPHVPFRNSKLTQVLQDSLCGSSKVLLVCNISPEPGSGAETLCSLNFASRAAQVELGQARKVTEKERPAQPASLQQQPAAAAAAKPPGREGLKPVRSSQSIGSGK